ncbi:MAG: hypothetical protein ACRBDI_10300 [Alphaproteobacteria bacterium]
MSKALKLIFTLSILLNIAFAGLIAGHSVKKMNRWSEVHADLSPETRELMRDVYKEKRSVIKVNMKLAAEKKQNLAYIFSSPEFDEGKFRSAVDDWKAFNAGVIDSKFETMSSVASKLSQDERVVLSKRFVAVLTGDHGHKGGLSKYRKFQGAVMADDGRESQGK